MGRWALLVLEFTQLEQRTRSSPDAAFALRCASWSCLGLFVVRLSGDDILGSLIVFTDRELWVRLQYLQLLMYAIVWVAWMTSMGFMKRHEEAVLVLHTFGTWTMHCVAAFAITADQHTMHCIVAATLHAAFSRRPRNIFLSIALNCTLGFMLGFSRWLASSSVQATGQFWAIGLLFASGMLASDAARFTEVLLSYKDRYSGSGNGSSSGSGSSGNRKTSNTASLLEAASPFDEITNMKLIGRGSCGVVYRGQWGSLSVAVKVVPYRLGEANAERAKAEAGFSQGLSHPNLVQTFLSDCRITSDSNQHAGDEHKDFYEMWIVQEFCNMGTLSRRLMQNEGRAFLTSDSLAPDVPQIIEVLLDIAGAMVYVHSRGLVHSDLYDSNVLLVSTGSPRGYVCKVSDFGHSRILNLTAGVWEHRTESMGCVTHMPPELFALDGACLTKAVDVYSFGIIIWQLFARKVPFAGLIPQQVAVIVSKGKRLEVPRALCAPTYQVQRLKDMFEECTDFKMSKRPTFSKVQEFLMATQKSMSHPLPSGE